MSRGLGDVYKRQHQEIASGLKDLAERVRRLSET